MFIKKKTELQLRIVLFIRANIIRYSLVFNKQISLKTNVNKLEILEIFLEIFGFG